MTNGESPTPVRVGATVVVALAILAASLVLLGIGWLARHHANHSVFHGAERIEVHESSFHIDLAKSTVKTGKIAFNVRNDASIPHEFVVFKTDLPADVLPLGKDGDVIEDAPQLKNVVDTGSSIDPGATRAVAANLKPGHYAVVCNLQGHYSLGMHITLIVTAR